MKHFIWKKPFSYGQAWAHMLMIANYEEGTIWVNNHPYKVDRGQIGKSQETLQGDFGWTRAQFRTFIKHLKNDHMISLEPAGKSSIITITNYDKYHGNDQEVDHETTMRQPIDNHETTANKKNKKNKKEKKEYMQPLLGEHKNVKVTEKEYDSLKEYVGSESVALDLIERLSIYLKSTGKRYSSHYATMQGWYRRDGVKSDGFNPDNWEGK
jgi:DNA replication protein DnaD